MKILFLLVVVFSACTHSSSEPYFSAAKDPGQQDEDRIVKLIAALEDDNPQSRDSAQKELVKIGKVASRHLTAAKQATKNPDLISTIDSILAQFTARYMPVVLGGNLPWKFSKPVTAIGFVQIETFPHVVVALDPI